jgi:hypothetical protein
MLYIIERRGDRGGGGEGAEEKDETLLQNYYLYGHDDNKCKFKTIEGKTKNEGAVGFLQPVLVMVTAPKKEELYFTPLFIIYFFSCLPKDITRVISKGRYRLLEK